MQLASMKTDDALGDADSLGSDLAREYGYGTCICLNDDQVRALGLTEPLPEPGAEMRIEARVVVTCTAVHKDGGGPEYRLSLQITDMGIQPSGTDSAALTSALYGA